MPRYKAKINLSKTYEALDRDEAFEMFISGLDKSDITIEEIPGSNIEVSGDDFYFDFSEFEDETQLTVIGDEKLKILQVMKEVIDKTIDAVKYQEPSEEEVNFSRLARYVSDMVELITLENNDASEEEIFEAIKRINIGVSKLKSYADIERYAQDYNEINGLDLLDEVSEEPDENDDSDDEFNF